MKPIICQECEIVDPRYRPEPCPHVQPEEKPVAQPAADFEPDGPVVAIRNSEVEIKTPELSASTNTNSRTPDECPACKAMLSCFRQDTCPHSEEERESAAVYAAEFITVLGEAMHPRQVLPRYQEYLTQLKRAKTKDSRITDFNVAARFASASLPWLSGSETEIRQQLLAAFGDKGKRAANESMAKLWPGGAPEVQDAEPQAEPASVSQDEEAEPRKSEPAKVINIEEKIREIVSAGKPVTRAAAKRTHKDNLKALRKAIDGAEDATLKSASHFAGRAFAAEVFDESETPEKLKADILQITTTDWGSRAYPADRAVSIISSAWDSGSAQPLKLKTKAKYELTGGEIVYGPQELDKCTRASEAVLASIGGKYFESNHRLVMPTYPRDEEEIEEFDIDRDNESVILAGITQETVVRDLDSHAKFVGKNEGGQGVAFYPILPPQEIAKQIFDRVKNNPNDVPFEHLDMLTNTPMLLASGEIHDSPGKLREGVLLVDSGVEFPRIESNPSLEDAKAALKLFGPIFSGFPFSEKNEKEEPIPWNQTASYSTVLAGVLTLCARSVLRKSVPLFGVTAPTPGTGKTHLVASAVLAVLGYTPTLVTYLDEIEFGKALLPILQAQDRAVLIDNIAVPLRSSKMCAVLTDSKIKDRILGKSEMVNVDNRSVFFCTGNHLTITGDLTRRTLMCSLDCEMERPEVRRFEFDPEQRAKESHRELLAAALTVLRAYIVAGKPWSLKRGPLGGYEKWDGLVTGALVWAGFPDPVATINTVVEDDPDRENNLQILRAWRREFGEANMRLAEIGLKTGGETREILLNKEGAWDSKAVAWRLRFIRDKVIDGMKLTKGRGVGGGDEKYWKVVSMKQGQARGEDELPF